MSDLIQKKISNQERNALRKERQEQERLAKIDAIPDTLHGVFVVDVPYTAVCKKRVKELRREFSQIRKEFLKDLATNQTDALRTMGLSEKAIEGMAKGDSPNGYNTHHKIPLAGGGQNVFENFILIKNDPYHTDMHKMADPQICVLKEGETKIIKLPMPKGNVFVAPVEVQKTKDSVLKLSLAKARER